MELEGRVAVVTGGGSGIGRAMAEAFAREHATVVVANIDEHAAVQALAETTFKTFGKVHVLCNNAGVALWGGLESATHRDIRASARNRHAPFANAAPSAEEPVDEQALLQPKA
jgi:NAD(P)-dependent dehydrogenase (short-subunit alcohol dehydrogenase family)